MDFGSVILGMKHGGRYRRSNWPSTKAYAYLETKGSPQGRIKLMLTSNVVLPLRPEDADILSTDWVGVSDTEKERLKNHVS